MTASRSDYYNEQAAACFLYEMRLTNFLKSNYITGNIKEEKKENNDAENRL